MVTLRPGDASAALVRCWIEVCAAALARGRTPAQAATIADDVVRELEKRITTKGSR